MQKFDLEEGVAKWKQGFLQKHAQWWLKYQISFLLTESESLACFNHDRRDGCIIGFLQVKCPNFFSKNFLTANTHAHMCIWTFAVKLLVLRSNFEKLTTNSRCHLPFVMSPSFPNDGRHQYLHYSFGIYKVYHHQTLEWLLVTIWHCFSSAIH